MQLRWAKYLPSLLILFSIDIYSVVYISYLSSMKTIFSISLLVLMMFTMTTTLPVGAQSSTVSGEARRMPIMTSNDIPVVILPVVTPRNSSAQRIKILKSEIVLLNAQIAKVQKKLDAANMKWSNFLVAIYQKKLTTLTQRLAQKQVTLDSLKK